ncbi:hypothetical protein VNO80_02715 [Phaseolus coccineus]|uniref:TAFII55 protein conserved region domain-containing protein n=1 Tax=Phaseolus coccineus TaxID=3886 RepID=A0AAN9NUR0_PHACN
MFETHFFSFLLMLCLIMLTSLLLVMDEQFILRVPPNVAERIERLLNETDPSSSEDKSLDLSFNEDGRSGTFMIGNEHFPASLLDLPCVVESYKTYDDNSLTKAADIHMMEQQAAEHKVEENARGANKKPAPKPAPKHDVPENLTNAGEPDRSDSEESDDSV